MPSEISWMVMFPKSPWILFLDCRLFLALGSQTGQGSNHFLLRNIPHPVQWHSWVAPTGICSFLWLFPPCGSWLSSLFHCRSQFASLPFRFPFLGVSSDMFCQRSRCRSGLRQGCTMWWARKTKMCAKFLNNIVITLITSFNYSYLILLIKIIKI